MFISLAPSLILCLSSILWVARTLLLSGSMKIFVDGCPVYSKSSASSGLPAPDVAPVSRIPVRALRFAIFHAQCAAILLLGPDSIADRFSFL
jgi:hypothetical protein